MFNPNFPLGLPKGSVRAILALSILGVALGKFWVDGVVPTHLLELVGIVVAFYFASRQNANNTSNS